MKKAVHDGVDIDTAVAKFLFQYRNCEHATTGVAPADAMFGRRLRGRLDVLRPSAERSSEAVQQRAGQRRAGAERSAEPGDEVLARDYRARAPKWTPVTVTARDAPLTYKVRLNDGQEWKRHIDQLLPIKKRNMLLSLIDTKHFPEDNAERIDRSSDNSNENASKQNTENSISSPDSDIIITETEDIVIDVSDDECTKASISDAEYFSGSDDTLMSETQTINSTEDDLSQHPESTENIEETRPKRACTFKGLDPVKADGEEAPVSPADSAPRAPDHCIVGGAHAFILRISSLFGLAPLRFKSRSNGFSVTLSGAMCVYSYILVTVLVICTLFGLVAEIVVGIEKSVRMSSRMSQLVSTCDVLVVVATAGAGVYGAPRRMRKLLKFMDSIASVDTSIGAQYSVATERKLCAVLLAILIFFSVLLADDFCFYAIQAKKLDRLWEVVTNYIGFYLLWYVVMILELQFAFTALSLRTRFQAVNEALALTARHVNVPLEKVRETAALNIFAIRVAPAESQRSANVSLLVDSLPGKEMSVIIKRSANGEPRLIVPPCEAIRRLASLHGTLCEVVRRIDDSYGLPLIVILISTLLHLIVTPYFLIMEIIVSTNRIHFLVLQFLWCATHMLRMFVVVEPSHYTIIEGKRTEELVCRLMMSAPSTGALPSRLELFSRQLLLQNVSYSPLGMCTLDRPLVASIIGAVTTYLVILIQFQRYDS